MQKLLKSNSLFYINLLEEQAFGKVFIKIGVGINLLSSIDYNSFIINEIKAL